MAATYEVLKAVANTCKVKAEVIAQIAKAAATGMQYANRNIILRRVSHE